MSQTEHRTLSVTDDRANLQDTALNPAQMTPLANQEPKSKFADSSTPFFVMSCDMADAYKKKAENRIASINNVIIFMSLFSAVLAALLSVTVPDLKQDPQNLSAYYLGNIYRLQILGGSNGSLASTATEPPRFSAPKSAIWVNTLLFSSLCLNICAVILAMLMREILLNYLWEMETPQFSPHYRARVNEILATEFYGSRASKALELVIGLSPLLFFVGLSIYLFHVNRVVFGLTLSCMWPCYIGIFIAGNSMMKITSRSKSSAGNDDRVLNRLFHDLIKDSDFVQFFENIPGFCRSSIVDNPRRCVTNLGTEKLHKAVKELLERTWSSNFLSYSEKTRRLVACVGFADAVRLPDVASSILKDIFPLDWPNAQRSVELGQLLRRQGNRSLEKIGLCAQTIVAGIISNVQRSNEGWVALAADQLGESEDVIRGYLERGNDDVLLANLTHITREIFHSSEDDQDLAASSTFILPSLSNFDIRNTLPELQSNFLSLWGQVEQAPNDRLGVRTEIRDNLFNLYNLLSLYNALPHGQGTNDGLNATASYNAGIHGNPSDSTPHDPTLSASSPHLSFLAPSLFTADPPDGTRYVTAATASPDPAFLESHDYSGTSQAVASGATATAGMATSTPSSATPEATSVFPPHVIANGSLVADHDALDGSDSPT